MSKRELPSLRTAVGPVRPSPGEEFADAAARSLSGPRPDHFAEVLVAAGDPSRFLRETDPSIPDRGVPVVALRLPPVEPIGLDRPLDRATLPVLPGSRPDAGGARLVGTFAAPAPPMNEVLGLTARRPRPETQSLRSPGAGPTRGAAPPPTPAQRDRRQRPESGLGEGAVDRMARRLLKRRRRVLFERGDADFTGRDEELDR